MRAPNIPISGIVNSYMAPGVVIGENVFIGTGVVICAGTIIKDNVVIGHNTVIEEDCFIGQDTRIQSHVYLAKSTRVMHRVFIGPMVCTTNDKRILSHGRGEFTPQPVVIMAGARIGARALIMPGVTIKEQALVGAGSIITKDVGAREVWRGVQAEKVGMIPDEEVLRNERQRKAPRKVCNYI